MPSRKIPRVLMISYTFPPQLTPESILITKLLRHAVNAHTDALHISAICADERTVIESMDPELKRLVPKKIPHTKLPSPERSLLWRLFIRLMPMVRYLPDKSLVWYLYNRRTIVKVVRKLRPDILYSRSNYLGSHLLALIVKRALGIPWVAYFSDPWVGNPYSRRGVISRHINRYWERSVITHANRLIFVCEELKVFTMRKYPKSLIEKCSVIPHCYDHALYPRPNRWPTSQWNMVLFSYIGNFYGTRSPKPLLQALSLLEKREPQLYGKLIIRIVGTVPTRVMLSGLFQQHRERLSITSPMPYRESLREMVAADVLLLIDADTDPNIFSPSKLFDYLGSGKPILGITPTDSPAAAVIREFHYPVTSPTSPEQICAAMVQLSRTILRERKNPRPPHNPPPEYSAERTTNTFAKLCDNLLRE